MRYAQRYLGTDAEMSRPPADMADRLPGAAPYLEMLAVTTAGSMLAETALGAEQADDPAAEEQAVLARFFAVNRVARVPGNLAAVSGLGPELAAGRTTVLS